MNRKNNDVNIRPIYPHGKIGIKKMLETIMNTALQVGLCNPIATPFIFRNPILMENEFN